MNLPCAIHSQQSYTEQQFFEKYKQLFRQEKAKNASHQSPINQFTGSWSWCTRFFERNPEYKKKLIASKRSLNDSIEDSTPSRNSSYLTINEKMQVFDDLSSVKSIPADKCNVSKSAVYKIKKEDDARQYTSDKVYLDRKVIKTSRYFELEKEVSDWCLQQQPFPAYGSIADKAYSIFITLDVKGNFNPSTKWAKEFVERHPELSEKCRDARSKTISQSSNEVIEEEETIENMQEESMEYIEPDFIKTPLKMEKIEHDDFGNEYIIEELDEDDNSEDLSLSNYEEQEQRESTGNKRKDDEIADEEAISSLKTLIKYSQQRGHIEISALLVEYQNILMEEENMS